MTPKEEQVIELLSAAQGALRTGAPPKVVIAMLEGVVRIIKEEQVSNEEWERRGEEAEARFDADPDPWRLV